MSLAVCEGKRYSDTWTSGPGCLFVRRLQESGSAVLLMGSDVFFGKQNYSTEWHEGVPGLDFMNASSRRKGDETVD